MEDMEKINFGELKAAAKAFNALELTESPIKTIGVSKEVLANSFCEVIEALSEEDAEKLSEDIVTMYNTLVGDEIEKEPEPEPEKETGKGGKKGKEKEKEPETTKENDKGGKKGKEKEKVEKPKKEKEKTEKKVTEREKGVFGSNLGSKANAMDEMIAAGSDIEDIMAKAGVTRSRVMTHAKFLEDHRGVTIEKTKDHIFGKIAKK